MSIIEDDKQDKVELSLGFSFVFKSLVQIGLCSSGLKSQKVKADYSSWGKPTQNSGMSPKYMVSYNFTCSPI